MSRYIACGEYAKALYGVLQSTAGLVSCTLPLQSVSSYASLSVCICCRLTYGGSLIRPESTGFGTVYFVQEILKDQNSDLKVNNAVACRSLECGMLTEALAEGRDPLCVSVLLPCLLQMPPLCAPLLRILLVITWQGSA